MWHSVIEELDVQDALGPGLPIACHRHPERVEYVSRPGQLSRIAPDGMFNWSFPLMVLWFTILAGGCMEQCDTLLKCGHLCPFKVWILMFPPSVPGLCSRSRNGSAIVTIPTMLP